ncbi:MAG: BadF/BadG/BcrA/BcrD ATPase family protein [Psychrobacillus sp.]
MYVLGIDGGGTKTTGIIATSKGEVVAKATVGGTNINSTGKIAVQSELQKLIRELKELAPQNFLLVKRVFAGMAGAGNITNQDALKAILQPLFSSEVSITIDHDAITALYSGTIGKPGVVQIAGTGAITYGVNEASDRARVGGWGHLFGDQGSGYAIGRDALEAAFKARDGLIEQTVLSDLLIQHFNKEELPDIIQVIYQAENPKKLISSLTVLVMKAVERNDLMAKHIIDQNGAELGLAISALVKQLFSQGNDVIRVVLVGGLFNRYDVLKESIERTIKNEGIHVDIIFPKILPAGGAVVAALLEENIEIDEYFLETFNRTNYDN